MHPVIHKSTLKFLKDLALNNNRDWFNIHKDEYLQAYENMIAFAESLNDKMNKHDSLEPTSGKKLLYRIYADVRFSKDKTPYKIYWSGRFKRATKKLRGGYYFHIEPGNTFVACGFFGNKKFKSVFGKLSGQQVSTAPKGYDKDHPAIDLLRFKQFIIKHSFTDKEIISTDFLNLMNDTFKQMRPFLDYMSEVLTTDLNGELLV